MNSTTKERRAHDVSVSEDSTPTYPLLDGHNAMMVRNCLIKPGCVDGQPSRPMSVCSTTSLHKLEGFARQHLSAADQDDLERHKVFQRVLVCATSLMGDDNLLLPHHIEKKQEIHLFLCAHMTWQWIVDDILDGARQITDRELSAFIGDYLIPAVTDRATLDRSFDTEIVASHFPILARVLVPLLHWWYDLGDTAGIDMSPDSLFIRFNREFVETMGGLGYEFDSWAAYENHRSRNCGLNPLVYCQFRWLYYQTNPSADSRELQRELLADLPLVYHYGIIGGLSNDLFGYEKDVAEGIATGVEVYKKCSAAAIDVESAFKRVIDIHNARIEELAELLPVREQGDESRHLLLTALLDTAHCIRDLHLTTTSIYRAQTLREILDLPAS